MTYGVDKIMLMLPIQIHHVLPKSYLFGALVEIKSKAASLLTKNRNVDLGFFFFLCIQMRATFMKQLQHAALHHAPPGIRCQSTNVLCRVSAVL